MQPFDIISKDDYYAIRNNSSVVAVILYTLDENSLLDGIGVVKENNPHFQSGAYTGLVMGKVENEDPSLLFRAKREVLEETGYDVKEDDRWSFLGEMYTSKIFPEPIYCYSVDITDLKNEKIKGDGSEHESSIIFQLLSLREAKMVNDSILLSCIFKLFLKLYKTELDGSTKQETETSMGS